MAAKAANCASDFRPKLPADVRAEEVVEAEPELVGWELAGLVDQVGDLRMGQGGRPLDDHQMQADPQRRVGAGSADGIGGGGRGDHQAGGLQDAVSMGFLNALVDGFGQAEIVGGEGDGFHAVPPAHGLPRRVGDLAMNAGGSIRAK